jgi:TusA-related sulfurtransferase
LSNTTHYLDISNEHCPMTFVKTKLKLETLSSGDVLEVTLKKGEPLENVPKTVTEQGYKVLDITHSVGEVYVVRIQK